MRIVRVMRKLLKKFSYDIVDKDGNNNKKANNLDLILLVVYTGISLFNALKPLINNTSTSLLVCLINIIILIRMNISIYIKNKECIKSETEKLANTGKVIKELFVYTGNVRMNIITYGYLIDIIVIITCVLSKTAKGLVGIVVVAVLETFFNNLCDNFVNRFNAKPKIYIQI